MMRRHEVDVVRQVDGVEAVSDAQLSQWARAALESAAQRAARPRPRPEMPTQAPTTRARAAVLARPKVMSAERLCYSWASPSSGFDAAE